MERSAVRHVCWNGTMLRRAYVSSAEVRTISEIPPDVTRSDRATGPFFQNFALGSAVWPDSEALVPPVSVGGRRQRQPRPRAVCISPFMPGSDSGGAIRAGVALEALAGPFDVQFVFVPVYGEAPVSQWVRELARATLLLPESLADPFLRRVPRISTRDERCRALVAYPRPFRTRFCTPEAAAEIVNFAGGDVDLVYVFRLYLAGLAEPWLADGTRRARFVLDLDEDDAKAARSVASLHRGDGHEPEAEVAEADATKYERMAERCIARADLVLAASPHEVAAVESLYPGVKAQVLPNPTPPTGEGGTGPAVDVLFVGNFGYLPNVDAARWLCGDILPLLRSRLGRSVRVAVVGSNLDERVTSLAADRDVEVVFDPLWVTPWYRVTTIAVAPLRAGGGTRLKILEAFSHRRPVVSTRLGAEGLPVTDGVHLLVADGADKIAVACARLISDSALRASLVTAAVEVAIDHARPSVVSRLTTLVRP